MTDWAFLTRMARSAAQSVIRGRGAVRVVLVGGNGAGKVIFLHAREAFPSRGVFDAVPGVSWFVYGRSGRAHEPLTSIRLKTGESLDHAWVGDLDALQGVEVPADPAVPGVWV